MSISIFKWRRAGASLKRVFFTVLAVAWSFPAIAVQEPLTGWTRTEIAKLEHWVRAAPEDGLPVLDTGPLHAAVRESDQAAIDSAATALALRLARIHLFGCSSASERAGWRIADTDASIDLEGWLARAKAGGGLDRFFVAVRPRHSDYAVLRAAYSKEKDPAKRATLARNMERWRWMPHSLGRDFVLVNAANFNARLWRQGRQVGTWPVIVGKTQTPTPVFSTTITGVTLNPWWNIPASIVREKRGRFPSSRGYVYSNGGWRQKPGPNNALGQMKLAMPNPYSVFMHDTPGKHLFERDVRAFSHGCIRTGDALGFATTLLEGVKTRAQVDAILKTRKTTTIDLPSSLPLYVTYFTASTQANGSLVIRPDIYGRDGRVGNPADAKPKCAA